MNTTIPLIEYEVREKQQFYNSIAESLQIYDPLDRPIFNSADELQSITTQDLKQELRNLKKLSNEQTRKLNLPLSTKWFEELDAYFNFEKERCQITASKQMELADKNNLPEGKDLRDEPEVKRAMNIFDFFAKFNLLRDSERRMHNFQALINRRYKDIQDIREQRHLQSTLKEQDQIKIAQELLLSKIPNILCHKANQNYDQMVPILCEIHHKLVIYSREGMNNRLKNPEHQKQLDAFIKAAQDKLHTTLLELCSDTEYLYHFAYELRKYFSAQVVDFTQEILEQYVDPLILHIIQSNKWNPHTKHMEVNTDGDFATWIHNKDKERLSYRKDQGDGNPDCKLHFLSIDDAGKDHQLQSFFHFQLTQCKSKFNDKFIYGLQIILDKQNKRLAAEPKQDYVEISQSLTVKWDYFGQTQTLNNQNCLWVLKPAENGEQSWYNIELTYGETRPRFVASNAFTNPLFKASMDAKDGYDDDRFNSWHIKQQEKSL